jgi:hypothetical protein
VLMRPKHVVTFCQCESPGSRLMGTDAWFPPTRWGFDSPLPVSMITAAWHPGLNLTFRTDWRVAGTELRLTAFWATSWRYKDRYGLSRGEEVVLEWEADGGDMLDRLAAAPLLPHELVVVLTAKLLGRLDLVPERQ